MRKNFCLALLLVAFYGFGQLPNPGFDVWQNDTASFGYPPFVQFDTFVYRKPQGWYSVNAITKNQYIGGKSLVDEINALALFGSASARLKTDSIVVASANNLRINLPGFIVNGNFKISLVDLLGSNSNLSPSAIPGAGTPINSRKQKIRAYVQYQPIPNDSLLIWAVLKKKDSVIAEAKMHYQQATSGTLLLEKEFAYTTCALPDTVVVMIASSTPDFFASGASTGVESGSVLIVDSVKLVDFAQGFVFPPFANRDQASTFRNTPKTIDVLANDFDCAGAPLQIVNVGSPLHGSAVLNGNKVVYTPNTNFFGVDSFPYTISSSNGTATAFVLVSVFSISDIDEHQSNRVMIYPNPAERTIHVRSDETIAHVLLMALDGREILSSEIFPRKEMQLDVSSVAQGMYLVRIINANGLQVVKRIQLK
jgi:hypothetical protein